MQGHVRLTHTTQEGELETINKKIMKVIAKSEIKLEYKPTEGGGGFWYIGGMVVTAWYRDGSANYPRGQTNHNGEEVARQWAVAEWNWMTLQNLDYKTIEI